MKAKNKCSECILWKTKYCKNGQGVINWTHCRNFIAPYNVVLKEDQQRKKNEDLENWNRYFSGRKE